MGESENPIDPKEAVSPNPIDSTLDLARSVVQRRREVLSASAQEVVRRFLKNRRLPLVLATLFALNSAGCSNVPQVELPVFGPKPAGATATPDRRPVLPPVLTSTPEPMPTPAIPDRLKYKDRLPEDIVSETELWAQYHTRIWNTDKVKLHIRRKALEEEPIFRDLHQSIVETQHFQEPRWNIEKQKIEEFPVEVVSRFDIVLVPGEVVRSKNLTEEQKKNLPEFYQLLKKNEQAAWSSTKTYIEANRQEILKRLAQDLKIQEDNLKSGKITQEVFNIIKINLDSVGDVFREDLSKYNFDSFFDKHQGFLLARFTHAEGLYVDAGLSYVSEPGGEKKYVHRYFIPLAVPESGNNFELDPDVSSFVPSEQFKLYSGGDREYPVTPASEVYISFALRHEFSHHISGHPMTDYIALNRYQAAYQLFLKGDDSWFYFVFETPKGNIVSKKVSTEKTQGKTL